MTSHRNHRRPALILLVIVAALGCLALGWWQWTRFESAGGTAQNLGYALQWPLFAVFVVYAYRRFVQLESDAPDRHTAPARPVAAAAPREIPPDLLPRRPTARVDDRDPSMDEYNRYLAELNARDNDGSTK